MMARRIVTARQQCELLSPWRTASAEDDLPYNQWPQERRDAHEREYMKKLEQERLDRRDSATKIYRGLRLDLPPELEDYINEHYRKDVPYNFDEIGGHLAIGPKLLDHLQKSHPNLLNYGNGYGFDGDDKLGLGRHWTVHRQFAEKAAMQGGRGKHRIVIEADRPGPEHRDPKRTGVGDWSSTGESWKEEEEDTLLPGTPLNVTGVKLNGKEVLHDPRLEERMPKDYDVPLVYPGGPRQHTAERADRFEWERSFDGGGGWILVTRNPDGNPVTVATSPTRGQRSSALQQRPPRQGELPYDRDEDGPLWQRPHGLPEDFDPFDDLDGSARHASYYLADAGFASPAVGYHDPAQDDLEYARHLQWLKDNAELFDGEGPQYDTPINPDHFGLSPLDRLRNRRRDVPAREAALKPLPQHGVNINDTYQDFTGQILRGEKRIETRDTNSLRPIIGHHVAIIRNHKREPSGLLVGYATIGEPKLYTNEDEFDADHHLHRVGRDSDHHIRWSKTGMKFGYPMLDVEPEPEPFRIIGSGIPYRHWMEPR